AEELNSQAISLQQAVVALQTLTGVRAAASRAPARPPAPPSKAAKPAAPLARKPAGAQPKGETPASDIAAPDAFFAENP
ncbi:MAG: hypothetical protein NTV51_10745, partial [Verrucomicrobia bacterium]|nr:hypothetical protein [Verrucomicrobiota bacterium]